ISAWLSSKHVRQRITIIDGTEIGYSIIVMHTNFGILAFLRLGIRITVGWISGVRIIKVVISRCSETCRYATVNTPFLVDTIAITKPSRNLRPVNRTVIVPYTGASLMIATIKLISKRDGIIAAAPVLQCLSSIED